VSSAEAIQRVWLTVDEARALSGVSRTELYIALQTNELPGTQRAKRGKWRIHRSDLDVWMRQGRVAS
jgi:excisionase family DNA binding protein